MEIGRAGVTRTTPGDVGRVASAPTEAPTSRSGWTPRAVRAWSMPTWTAPRLPPPDTTKAVVTVQARRRAGKAVARRARVSAASSNPKSRRAMS